MVLNILSIHMREREREKKKRDGEKVREREKQKVLNIDSDCLIAAEPRKQEFKKVHNNYH